MAEQSFAELFEQSTALPEEGTIVKGHVVRLEGDYAVVDIGSKSEGLISLSEFQRGPEPTELQAGDEVEVLFEKSEDENGAIVLSKDKADRLRVWDKISAIAEEDGTIFGRVLGRVKGGLAVDIGVKAFLPGSQIDLRPVRDLDSLMGQKFEFKILKFNKQRNNIVLSRRALLEKEREKLRSTTLRDLEEGKMVEGVVKNITDYGAFIDLGGVDGLLHITDMSWGRVGHPSELFKVGDEAKVVVLHYDKEKERVSLGLKQMSQDPWTSVPQRFPSGERVTGKVVSITDYGAFVEIEPGVEGLIHVSEMSWSKKPKHPSKFFEVGQRVEAIVQDVDVENRRISLSYKATEPNPWDAVADKYPPGTRIQGQIKNITDFGVFVGIEEGIDGLIHVSDISWTQRINNPAEIYKKADVVEAVVLHVDRDNERFSLGVKQLTEDPWLTIGKRFPVGSVIKGKVTNVTDFGLFVELEPGIEGLVRANEITRDKADEAPQKKFNGGDEVKAVVLNIDPHERKISLSIKAAEDREEGENVREYGSESGMRTALGEKLKEKLESKS